MAAPFEFVAHIFLDSRFDLHIAAFERQLREARAIKGGLNIRAEYQAALDSPRFTKLTFEGCDVKVESRIEKDVRDELERRGHKLQVLPPYAQDVGGGQAVMRNYSTGVNFGASDPRKDGAAIPEPLRP